MSRLKLANIWLSHDHFSPLWKVWMESTIWKFFHQLGCDFRKPVLPATITNGSELATKLRTGPVCHHHLRLVISCICIHRNIFIPMTEVYVSVELSWRKNITNGPKVIGATLSSAGAPGPAQALYLCCKTQAPVNLTAESPRELS